MSVLAKYNARVDDVNSLLCVSLDPEFTALPQEFKTAKFPQFEFNKFIIEQTHDLVSAFKANIAFYEARGDQGYHELKLTMKYLQKNHSKIFTICDAKRADVENTSKAYAEALFDWFGFDAVTLNPYLGQDVLQPFLWRADKGCIVLCRTSNPGAREFQDLLVKDKPLWQVVAERVKVWNQHGNCLLVVGGTYPEELRSLRKIMGEMTFLVPGFGVQGGDIKAVLEVGLNQEGKGLILVVARSVILAPNPREAALKFREEINHYR